MTFSLVMSTIPLILLRKGGILRYFYFKWKTLYISKLAKLVDTLPFSPISWFSRGVEVVTMFPFVVGVFTAKYYTAHWHIAIYTYCGNKNQREN